jgi:GntR family transcriptional regulator of arabinose operon
MTSCLWSYKVVITDLGDDTEMIVPKYRKILDQLTQDIASGKYQPGQKFPSEAALVNRFGTSRITVGRAVRELQQSGLVDRVAGSGTYVGSRARRNRDAPVFGLIIPNLGETEIFEPICRAIAVSQESQNHALLWPQGEDAIQLARQCVARGVSGVFFAALEMSPESSSVNQHSENQQVMRTLKEAGIPVVQLDRRPDDGVSDDRCDLVGIDNHRAAVLATNHLLDLGARRIGFVAYRGQASTVKARIQGYRDALAEAGVNAPQVFYLNPDKSPEKSVESAGGFDAFVCANDRIAGRLMHGLLSHGVRIPQDVRIVGMDDVKYAALLPVPLTTIHQPCGDIGETALRLMLDRLDHPHMPARDVLLDCSLVIRQSCGMIT